MNVQVLTSHYKTLSFQFLGAYVTTMRPYLLFVSGITGMAGMSWAEGVTPEAAMMVFLAAFLSYGFGQALTDCFQTDTDSISAPYRPLVQDLVSVRQVFTVSLLGLLGCVAILATRNPDNILLGGLAAFGLATYTTFKRRWWWAGPFYNAWIVAVLCIMGLLAGAGQVLIEVSVGLICTVLAVFFGYANFVLAGYFKDVEADRATGYRTLPVRFGRRAAACVSHAFAVIAIIFVLITDVVALESSNTWPAVTAVAFLCAGCVASLRGQTKLHRVQQDAESHPAIALTVHAYILLLSSIAIARKPEWAVFLLVFYGVFVLVLRSRPMASQI